MPIANKEKRRAYINEWQRNNKDKCRASHNKYLENNPKKKLLKSSKYNAKVRGLEHTISEEDIVIPTHCPYLGIELTVKISRMNTPNMISLDRIDSTKGYIKGNVEVISHLANLMKSFATKEQLVIFAKSVLNRFGM